MAFELIQTDITLLAVEAIVNAANESLLGGGGVDGAIHRAAGPALLAACRALPEVAPGVRCPTGEARITEGFALPARFVIHTVGPIWHGGSRNEPGQLAACYRNVLKLARTEGVGSIAFPAISAGVYGYPAEAAARVAIDTLRSAPWRPERVVFCTFGLSMTRAYERLL
jgi:O-acetyl-ADP-ribose deacetylase (regulator of RNase III)